MSVLARVAAMAAAESPLWRDALLPGEPPAPRFAGACPDRYLLGVEAIYEGYLLHYGRSRLFARGDRDLALLAGDYLYAAGLAAVSETGDLDAVAALAALISRCARNHGAGDAAGDDALWRQTVTALGRAG